MPSVFTHAVAGLALGYALAPAGMGGRAAAAGALCAVLPDVDAISFWIGDRHAHLGAFAHRGLTHSLLFAALVASIAAAFVARNAWWRVAPALFVAAASHGLLDALTNGGSGVAFFAPFNETRYFFPARPIRVSPISPSAFFSYRGWRVLQSEMLWVWLPAAALAAARAIRLPPARH